MATRDSGACYDGMPSAAETIDTQDCIRSSCMKKENIGSSYCKVELRSSARYLPTASQDSHRSRSRPSRSRNTILRRRLCATRRRELSRRSFECSSNSARFEMNGRDVVVGDMSMPRSVYPTLGYGDFISHQVASYLPHGLPCFPASRSYSWTSACYGYSLSSLPVMVQIPFMYTWVPIDNLLDTR